MRRTSVAAITRHHAIVFLSRRLEKMRIFRVLSVLLRQLYYMGKPRKRHESDPHQFSEHMKRDIGWYNGSHVDLAHHNKPVIAHDQVIRFDK